MDADGQKVLKVGPPAFDATSAQWLRGRDLKPRTREGYEHLLRSHLIHVLGPLVIDTITPSVVRTWWSQVQADKPAVRARNYALLRAVMNTAVVEGQRILKGG